MVRGDTLLRQVEQHGGIVAIHVEEVSGGWRNRLECADGWTFPMYPEEERRLQDAMDERRRKLA